jgi:hypothetical protein
MGCWVFFRAISFDDVLSVFSSLGQWNKPPLAVEFTLAEIVYGLALVFSIPLAELFRWQEKAHEKWPWAVTAFLLVAAYMLGNFKSTSFLYFQF